MSSSSSNTQQKLMEQARVWIKSNKTMILEYFASDKVCPAESDPVSIFMAGAMGAGKTEFAKRFLGLIDTKIVRINLDDIRQLLPGYNGQNSDVLNYPAGLGVEYLHDYCLKNKKSFLLDSSFSNSFEKLVLNINRSLSRHRKVSIYYVYQDPLLSWQFTQKREKIDGRNVTKEVFLNSFFESYLNILAVKQQFNKQVELNFVIRPNKQFLVKRNIQSIEDYVILAYNIEELIKLL